jgi:hypothetical protein
MLRIMAPHRCLLQAKAGQDVSQGHPSSLCLWSNLWVYGEAASEMEATLDERPQHGGGRGEVGH